MNVKKPNRTRTADADRNEIQQKQSGDQHILPLDESDDDPYRPHRASRQSQTVQAGNPGSVRKPGGESGSR
jgi:hypothetical protein